MRFQCVKFFGRFRPAIVETGCSNGALTLLRSLRLPILNATQLAESQGSISL
jgi:hypothetical protein